MTIQTNEFRDRLARIEAGIGSTRNTLFVGMDESYVIAPRRKAPKQANLLENLGFGLGRVWAVTLGVLSVVAVVMMRYWLGLDTPLPGDPMNDQGLIGILALCLAIWLGKRLYSNREGLIGLHASGVLMGTVGLHNLVHAAPHVFDTLFSPIWTGAVLSATEPFSVILRGMSLSLL